MFYFSLSPMFDPRYYKEDRWRPRKIVSTTLDGNLLDKYAMLSLAEQVRLRRDMSEWGVYL